MRSKFHYNDAYDWRILYINPCFGVYLQPFLDISFLFFYGISIKTNIRDVNLKDAGMFDICRRPASSKHQAKGLNMPDDEEKLIIYALIVIIYAVLAYCLACLEKHLTSKKIFSEQEYLIILARQRECSEYDIFCLAAKDWNISSFKAEEDFKIYIQQGDIPYYTRDFIRKHKNE